MVLSEFELHRYDKILKEFVANEGPRPHVRDQVKWEFIINPMTHAVEFYEIRPLFNDPSRNSRTPFAKARYVKKTKK